MYSSTLLLCLLPACTGTDEPGWESFETVLFDYKSFVVLIVLKKLILMTNSRDSRMSNNLNLGAQAQGSPFNLFIFIERMYMCRDEQRKKAD